MSDVGTAVGSDAKGCIGSRTELLNVLGEVKARVQDKLGIVDFPMPQFILVGKQSVGKSRLVEALAGECFNFVSGRLGSRRPTVLEFRNISMDKVSKWYMRDRSTRRWTVMPIQQLMLEVGRAHEELGESVSFEPIYVRIESPFCVDMQVVDLPGFRDFAIDQGKQELQQKIEALVDVFMRDKNNVILCIEQAGDASTMSTLQKCREVDPQFHRTILIRNKLDKYYNDLTTDNVDKWVQGFDDLSSDLDKPSRFALTLPFWREGEQCPRSFVQMRRDKSLEDVRTMKLKGLSEKYKKYIGFDNFAMFMENKVELMFSEAIVPVMTNLQNLKASLEEECQTLKSEYIETDPQSVAWTTRDCGISFATALTYVMEGILGLSPMMSLEDELKTFHTHHKSLESKHFSYLPSVDFSELDDYICYLRDEVKIAAFDVEINGGAQYRRLINEADIFLRLSEVTTATNKKDVIQAWGVSAGSLTWRDVVVKLLSNGEYSALQQRLAYVAERLRWFFESQKLAILGFMSSLDNSRMANLYSPLYPKHAKLITHNPIIKAHIFRTYDAVCVRQMGQFQLLFNNMLTSIFSNPWLFLKGATVDPDAENEEIGALALPSFDDMQARVPREIRQRRGVDAIVSRWLLLIPCEEHLIDEAVDRVQMMVLKTYSFIRSNVCDQVELFAESFFKLPLLRCLEDDMATIELSETDLKGYQSRREGLEKQVSRATDNLKEVIECVESLKSFRLKSEGLHVRAS